MLLEQVKEDIQSGGLGQGNAFTIAASAKAFEVLSSNLYQNKVAAVIREITCNAVDAHRLVGKPVSDIAIHMPTYLDPYFAVRDYGPGLSHEDVLSLYTTYFRSTKDASNALIGGFGLGSKSPFAVADQFTVTSWHGGERRTYVCYKDGGVPAINHISTEPTQEGTGLEVRVAASGSGLSQWAVEAEALFRWWSVVPGGVAVAQYALRDDAVLVKTARMVGEYPEWAVISDSTAPVVLMGGVPYSLNLSAITGLTMGMAQSLTGIGLVLGFEIGDLNISPSRETLSYDAATCAKLRARLTDIQKELVASVEAHLASLPTLWEARRYILSEDASQWGNTAGTIARRFKNNLQFAWKGTRISREVDLALDTDFSAAVTLAVCFKQNYRKTWNKSLHHWNYTATIAAGALADYWFWADALTSKAYRKAQYAASEEAQPIQAAYGRRLSNLRVQILTGIPFDEAERVLAEKGLPPLRKVADLADPPATAPGVRKPTLTKGYFFDVTKSAWARTEASIDLKAPGYWAKFRDGQCHDLGTHSIRALTRLGLIDDALPIVGFGKARWEGVRFEGQMTKLGWKRLDWSLIHGAGLAEVERASYEKTLSSVLGDAPRELLKTLQGLRGLVTAPDFAPLVDTLAKDCKVRDWSRSYLWEFEEYYSDPQKDAAKKGSAAAVVVINKWEGWKAAHPLLKCALGAPGVSAQDIADYLNR